MTSGMYALGRPLSYNEAPQRTHTHMPGELAFHICYAWALVATKHSGSKQGQPKEDSGGTKH